MHEYGEVLKNIDLKNYNTYKIGGKAKYLIKPYNINKLQDLIVYLKNNNIKYLILGKGSNVILPDEDFNGVIIILDYINNLEIDNEDIIVEAGISLNKLILTLIENDLIGLENLYGIPGTLGGAIVQNAGCHGSSISDKLLSVTYIDNNEIKTINKEECLFSYRNSIFKTNKDLIVIKCRFSLNKGNKKDLQNKIKENMEKRFKTQPLEYPNAGSVFKNPTNLFSGKLIEDIGLKGYHINGAYVSEKHANFIINKNKATSKDIIDLINYIKTQILKEYNIELILEQEIVKY